MNYLVPFPHQLPATKKSSTGSAATCSKDQLNAYTNHFEINSIEELRSENKFGENGPLQTDSYELFWIKQGSGTLECDLATFAITDNTIYFLCPGTIRHLQTENFIDGYYLSFSADFFYHTELQNEYAIFRILHDGCKGPLVVAMDEEMMGDLEQLIRKMVKEYSHYNLLRSEILQGLFILFMIYISRTTALSETPFAQNKDLELVRKFTALLKKNITTQKLVSDYAGALFVTPAYLNQVVKKVSGFTASHLIQQQIILEAKRQAIYSDASMKEIACNLGFTDLFHFSKFFKKNSGLNFSSFRKKSNKII